MSWRSINSVVGCARRAARASLHRLDEHRGLPARTFEEQRYRRETYARPVGRPFAYEMRRPRMSRNAAFRNCGTPSNVICARGSAERSACDACDASSQAQSLANHAGRSQLTLLWLEARRAAQPFAHPRSSQHATSRTSRRRSFAPRRRSGRSGQRVIST